MNANEMLNASDAICDAPRRSLLIDFMGGALLRVSALCERESKDTTIHLPILYPSKSPSFWKTSRSSPFSRSSLPIHLHLSNPHDPSLSS